MSKKLILLILVVVGGFYLIIQGIRAGSQVGINQGYEPDQPINYSHKIHAGDNKISCLYCHTSAEKGRHAGIPSANICMNCHTQIKKDSPEIAKIKQALEKNTPIEWVKVHRLPDFAYFNHSQHVTANVSCQECHGPVETMTRMRQEKPLTMGWCIGCHRDRGVTPPESHPAVDASTKELNRFKAMGGLDCAKCHY